MRVLTPLWLALGAALLTSACGGGGSGSTTSAATPSDAGSAPSTAIQGVSTPSSVSVVTAN